MAILRFLTPFFRQSRRYYSQLFKMDDSNLPTSSVDTSPASNDSELEKFKATLDDEKRQILEFCIAEYEFMKTVDDQMPSRVSVLNWRRLLHMDSKVDRIVLYTFLHRVEKQKALRKMTKMQAREEVEKIIEMQRAEMKRLSEEHIYYGFSGSNIFRRHTTSHMKMNLSSKLARAMVMGPHLVIDMSLQSLMRPSESSLSLKQLVICHHENRLHRYPHHLIFTGCDRNSEWWRELQRYFVGGFDSYLHTATEKHYLDLFPKEQLVYLSPDADQVLEEYDSDKVYIMAALVDKRSQPKVTWTRAMEEGIEARRLPLKDYAKCLGRTGLCLNHVVDILNDAHADGSIPAALLKHLPRRKIIPKDRVKASKEKQLVFRERMTRLFHMDESDKKHLGNETLE